MDDISTSPPSGATIPPSAPTPPIPPAADAPSSPTAPPSRPDWLPEGLWDATAGKPSADLSDLAQRVADADARTAALPKDAAGYQPALPDGFQAPEGWSVAAADPALADARAFAHKAGLTQAQFSGVLALKATLDARAAQAQEAALQAEVGKLGIRPANAPPPPPNSCKPGCPRRSSRR